MISVSLSLSSCDSLINDMETSDNIDWLNLENTALAVNDLVTMGLNSESGVFIVSYDSDNTGHEVSIEAGASCVSMNSGLTFPYADTSWSASFTLSLNGCEGTSGSIHYGIITVTLSGPHGSVDNFGFSGILNTVGTMNGSVAMNIEYELDYDCIVNWDCWSGTVNGYTIAALYNAYIN